MSVRKVFLRKKFKNTYEIVSDKGHVLYSFYAENEKEAEQKAKNYMSSFGSIALLETLWTK